jgi:hypothetical protein
MSSDPPGLKGWCGPTIAQIVAAFPKIKRGFPSPLGARFVKGTLARIDAVLRPRAKGKPPEYRTDFIAEAVERGLRRRERKPPKPRAKP